MGVQRAPLEAEAAEDADAAAASLVLSFVRMTLLGLDYDSDGLAEALHDHLAHHPSDFRFVRKVFHLIPDDFDDNVGAELIKLTSNPVLSQYAARPDGAAMLDVIYQAIITGKVSGFERMQGDRILASRRISEDKYVAQAQSLPVFPIRNMGITRSAYATFHAELLPNGNVSVHYTSSRVDDEMFREEMKTLSRWSYSQIMSGIELAPNDIVGVKLYDEDEGTQTVPAIALIDYSNQIQRSTLGTAATVFFAGLTLGMGGVAVGAGRGARALLWADRAAAVLPVLDAIANDHRDWIVKNVPGGSKVMWALDTANSIAAYYGMARLGWGGLKFLKSTLSTASAARRAAQLPAELSAAEREIVDELDRQFAKLENDVAEAEKAASEVAAAKATPPPAQELEVHPGGGQKTAARDDHLASLDEAGNAKPWRPKQRPPTQPPKRPTPAAPASAHPTTVAANDNAAPTAAAHQVEVEARLAAGAENTPVMAQKPGPGAKRGGGSVRPPARPNAHVGQADPAPPGKTPPAHAEEPSKGPEATDGAKRPAPPRRPIQSRVFTRGGIEYRVSGTAEDFERLGSATPTRYQVYEIRNASNQTVYVGITGGKTAARDAIVRLREHLTTKAGNFIGDADMIYVRALDVDERLARALEDDLISEKNPFWNKRETDPDSYLKKYKTTPTPEEVSAASNALLRFKLTVLP